MEHITKMKENLPSTEEELLFSVKMEKTRKVMNDFNERGLIRQFNNTIYAYHTLQDNIQFFLNQAFKIQEPPKELTELTDKLYEMHGKFQENIITLQRWEFDPDLGMDAIRAFISKEIVTYLINKESVDKLEKELCQNGVEIKKNNKKTIEPIFEYPSIYYKVEELIIKMNELDNVDDENTSEDVRQASLDLKEGLERSMSTYRESLIDDPNNAETWLENFKLDCETVIIQQKENLMVGSSIWNPIRRLINEILEACGSNFRIELETTKFSSNTIFKEKFNDIKNELDPPEQDNDQEMAPK